jgi:hypothetical protein
VAEAGLTLTTVHTLLGRRGVVVSYLAWPIRSLITFGLMRGLGRSRPDGLS